MATQQSGNGVFWTDFIAFPRNSTGTGYSTQPWGWKVEPVPSSPSASVLAVALNQFRTELMTFANLSGTDLEVRPFSLSAAGVPVAGSLITTLAGRRFPGVLRLADGSYQLTYLDGTDVKTRRIKARVGEDMAFTVASSGDTPTPPILDSEKRLLIPYYSGTGWSLAVGTINADGTWTFHTGSMGITTTKKGGQLIQLPGGEYLFFYVDSSNVVTARKSRRIANDGTSDSWV